MDNKLQQQIGFIEELDKLKSVKRRTRLLDNSRHENGAEHSWHIAMMAIALSEYANEPVDILKVVKMLLIHDIPEIDAGDAFLYDEKSREENIKKEKQAAARIFGLLPEDAAKEFLALWEEFEKKETPEAKFAGALDRLEPLLQNYKTCGYAWKKHGVTRSQVMQMNACIEHGSGILWEFARRLIDSSVEKGYLEVS